MDVKKVIIPSAGLATRFLPLSKVVPKEFLPLADEPMISYVVREAKNSGITQVVFVLPENRKGVAVEYFKSKPKIDTLLKKRNQKEILERVDRLSSEFGTVSFATVVQKTANGDGDAVLKAKKQAGKGAFAVAFNDDIFDAKVPALLQLKKVFSTAQKTVVGLKKVSKEKLPFYGVVKVEKIANRLYKIKEVIEKPEPEAAPSDLAICGRYILPFEIFGYLDKTKPNKKNEIILAETLRAMLKDGKIIYGYEIEGDWLECGKISDWLHSNLYFCLKHPEYGPALKQWFKKIK